MRKKDIVKKDDIMRKDDIMKSVFLDPANLYVGIDLHKKYYTGTIMDSAGKIVCRDNFPPTLRGAGTFFNFVPPATKMAIEACSLWRGAYKLLIKLGYHVVLAHPAKTRAISGTKKTDPVDSRDLADLLRVGYLPQVYIPDEDMYILKCAARHKADLVRIRQMLQCKIKSYLDREGIFYKNSWSKENLAILRSLHPHVAHYVEGVETMNRLIKDSLKEIRALAHNTYLAGILQTAPGIAEFSSLMILGEVSDVKRFETRKNLVSYGGLCPGIYQSGDKCYPVKNRACNTWLKWIMYVCSRRATRMDTKYTKHYERVKKRKGKKVAKRSTARKMLEDVWCMLTYEHPYIP